MAGYKFSLRVNSVTIGKNGRSNDSRIKNRIIIQVVSPGGTEHPSTTFSFKGEDGKPLTKDQIEKVLPFGLAFKLVKFEPVFDEPLRIRLHFLQDTERDWFQRLPGRFIKLALGAVLGGEEFIGVKLNKLLALDESVKLDEKTYSQKLGTIQKDFLPKDFKGTKHRLSTKFVLTANEDVKHLMLGKPGKKPIRRTIVKEGADTAEIEATLVLQPVS